MLKAMRALAATFTLLVFLAGAAMAGPGWNTGRGGSDGDPDGPMRTYQPQSEETVLPGKQAAQVDGAKVNSTRNGWSVALKLYLKLSRVFAL
jgi:hypothetical protein